MKKPVYVFKQYRTTIGQTGGYHRNTLPEILMAQVLKHLLDDHIPLSPTSIDDCILANAVGPMGNLARLAWLHAGLPLENTSTSIDFQCGGSLKAIQLAYSLIASGQGEAVIAGGMESTSLEPQRFYHPEDPRKSHFPNALKRAQFAPENIGDVDMLQGAESTAKRFGLTREALDEYALTSHHRALETTKLGILNDIILPYKDTLVDESIRPSISMRLLQRAKPLLGEGGLTTAGNACLMHDGAAGLLLGSANFGREHNIQPIAELLDFVSLGVDPRFSPLGATEALLKLQAKTSIMLEDLDCIEINEAFASKILAFHMATKIPLKRINPLGGALAFGHPYAASGAIYTQHLIKALQARGGGIGAIALGVAGGQGIAALIRSL